MAATATRIDAVRAEAYRVPTDAPESDGTLEWDATTVVVVHASGGGETGLGYAYADAAAAQIVTATLAPVVEAAPAFAVGAARAAMVAAVRNIGRRGVAAGAIAAVDVALWDLKARLLDLPLADLLGRVRPAVPLYGSGGFTSYSTAQLQEQLAGWVEHGLGAVKMKVGRHPEADPDRVRTARAAIGDGVALFVDANGAHTPAEAVAQAARFADAGVTWFEEPVSSDDLAGLAWVRARAPVGMEIAAGEYGHDPGYFRRMLDAGAVDCLQADATRCEGISGFLAVGALCAAHHMPLSAHTAPALHAHVCCAVEPLRHLEYFHDHVRVEELLFDGVGTPRGGALWPDASRPGLGLELKRADAERFAA